MGVRYVGLCSLRSRSQQPTNQTTRGAITTIPSFLFHTKPLLHLHKRQHPVSILILRQLVIGVRKPVQTGQDSSQVLARGMGVGFSTMNKIGAGARAIQWVDAVGDIASGGGGNMHNE